MWSVKAEVATTASFRVELVTYFLGRSTIVKIFLSLCAALSVAATSNAVRAGQITIEAEKDNTLYFTEDGSLSNGAGQYLFAGNTAAGVPGRAVLAFDIAGNIPPGSTIDGVVLTLEMSRTR